MVSKIKQLYANLLAFLQKDPKRTFKYAMISLSVLFLLSIALYFFFPKKGGLQFAKPPTLYENSGLPKATKKTNHTFEMDQIVDELKLLKQKRDTNGLTKQDSLRVEYLYQQYQNLKKDNR